VSAEPSVAIESRAAGSLVSCICPTHNRPEWIARSIRCFLDQDYAHRELLIVDDGTDSVAHLVPNDGRVRYHRLDRRLPVGAKRNLACELARGVLIAHWDDDDWYPSWRLSRQIATLSSTKADISGTSQLYYCDSAAQKAFRYAYADRRPWVAGNTFLYRKSFWQRNRFLDLQVGEDSHFLSKASPDKILDLKDPRLCIASIHTHNTSPKNFSGPWWRSVPWADLEDLSSGVPAIQMNKRCSSPAGSTTDGCMVRCGYRIAKENDLRLTEYSAFNHAQALPPMRKWELPWALFAAQLGNTSSVLDCTINPVNFCERIARLYPKVKYAHVSPVQNGTFQLPFGIPDESFDGVFCINTLEHLVREQRKELIADLARKLKPGGLLLLTSDYYFDSSWTAPAFLNAGVVRSDRAEFFGGWNRIRVTDWVQPCQANGLVPVNWECGEEPQEEDPDYYRNPAPFPHATIAGVFSKGNRPQAKGKRIVLALLTWNTRDVSIDSIRAYIREARMLARLGCEPHICVCDNGSTDGSQAAILEMDAQIDVPHKFILNSENLGNSIARNQIIEYLMESGGDYLLFLDGDIEIVPFSSFAMLRYMENSGYRLGCIGADFRGQSAIRAQTTPYLYSIDAERIDEVNWVAWTQYGMFRRAVFERGVRFDESGPFKGPGWGFEDNDLAFQLQMSGFRIQYFSGVVYLHRAVRSSVRIMRQLGHDPRAPYERRKQYVINKWESVPQINNGPLMLVRRVQMQL